MGGSKTPPPAGNTAVTLYLSSSANNELMKFNMGVTAITLTSQTGKTVTLPVPSTQQAGTPNSLEFEHLNGTAEPLLTANIPSGIYTGMMVTVSNPSYGCATLTNGGIHLFDGLPALISSSLAVYFPSVVITGPSAALDLNLDVSASFPLSSCSDQGFNSGTPVQPKFTLTRLTPASSPTDTTSAESPNLLGMVTAVDASGGTVTVASPDGLSWAATVNSSTSLQGVSSLSSLKVGMVVDLNLELQSDGAMLATRVDVLDTNVSNLSMMAGPLLFVSNQVSAIYIGSRSIGGSLFAGFGGGFAEFGFDDSQSIFQIAGAAANLQSLPFQARFDAANLVAGQRVALTTDATSIAGGSTYTPASTITLLPQTIDGTVTSTGSAGGFTVYTVQLASYDAFPTFAVQAGQTTQLSDPSTVMVYADSNTQMLNTSPVSTGSGLRFTGLVFNDNGTLRMDCFSVDQGAPE